MLFPWLRKPGSFLWLPQSALDSVLFCEDDSNRYRVLFEIWVWFQGINVRGNSEGSPPQGPSHQDTGRHLHSFSSLSLSFCQYRVPRWEEGCFPVEVNRSTVSQEFSFDPTTNLLWGTEKGSSSWAPVFSELEPAQEVSGCFLLHHSLRLWNEPSELLTAIRITI